MTICLLICRGRNEWYVLLCSVEAKQERVFNIYNTIDPIPERPSPHLFLLLQDFVCLSSSSAGNSLVIQRDMIPMKPTTQFPCLSGYAENERAFNNF